MSPDQIMLRFLASVGTVFLVIELLVFIWGGKISITLNLSPLLRVTIVVASFMMLTQVWSSP